MSSLTRLLQEKRKNEVNDSLATKGTPAPLRLAEIDRDATAHNSQSSITTVTQIDSGEESSEPGTSFSGQPQFSSSFLNVNSAHTAMFGQSVPIRDASGSIQLDSTNLQGTSYGSSVGQNGRAMRTTTPTTPSQVGSSGAKQIPSLSSSIPYSVPNSNKDSAAGSGSSNSSFTSSWLETYGGGMPSNISAIDSNIISSPKVDTVEPRFVISKQKLQKSSLDNAAQSGSLSRSNSLSSQFGNLFFSKNSKDSPTTNGLNLQTPSSTIKSPSSPAATAIPKPGRARQSSIYISSRQPSSYSDNFVESPSTSAQENIPSQSGMRSRHSSVVNLKSFFKKSSTTNLSGGNGLSSSPGTNMAVPYASQTSGNSGFAPSSYGSSNGDTIYSHTNDTLSLIHI